MTLSLQKTAPSALLWGALAAPFAAIAQSPADPVTASEKSAVQVEARSVPASSAANVAPLTTPEKTAVQIVTDPAQDKAATHVEPVTVPDKAAAQTESVSVPDKPAAVAHSATPDKAFTLFKANQTVSSQLQKLAADAGWKVIWEASDYLVEQDIFVSSDFLKTVTAVVDSISASGSVIKATFYQGNFILRVTGE